VGFGLSERGIRKGASFCFCARNFFVGNTPRFFVSSCCRQFPKTEQVQPTIRLTLPATDAPVWRMVFSRHMNASFSSYRRLTFLPGSTCGRTDWFCDSHGNFAAIWIHFWGVGKAFI
jgi:hypothetical protein